MCSKVLGTFKTPVVQTVYSQNGHPVKDEKETLYFVVILYLPTEPVLTECDRGWSAIKK